jgi:hypothetical protein
MGNCGVPILHPYLRTSSGHPLVLVVKTTENRSSDDPARLRWARVILQRTTSPIDPAWPAEVKR